MWDVEFFVMIVGSFRCRVLHGNCGSVRKEKHTCTSAGLVAASWKTLLQANITRCVIARGSITLFPTCDCDQSEGFSATRGHCRQFLTRAYNVGKTVSFRQGSVVALQNWRNKLTLPKVELTLCVGSG